MRISPMDDSYLQAGAVCPAPDDALPGIDLDPDAFPKDCVDFSESIPSESLQDRCSGNMLEVCVREVYSPAHFWMARLGQDYSVAVGNMIDEMTDYYNGEEGRGRTLARGAVRVGHYCSSPYEREWRRVLIVKIIDCDTVKVRHVDYGTVDTVAVGKLKPLRRCWARLPAQAIRARLAGVKPVGGARIWPHCASLHFLKLVKDKHFVANVVAIYPEANVIHTLLIDTSGCDDRCMSFELFREGHAGWRRNYASVASYFYPTFEALESGDTPNLGEIFTYLRNRIRLDTVEAYRRHVPTGLLPYPPWPSPSPELALPPASVSAAPASAAPTPVLPTPGSVALRPDVWDEYHRLARVNPNAAYWFMFAAIASSPPPEPSSSSE